jgi:toxin YoeB
MRDITFTKTAWKDFIEWSVKDGKMFTKVADIIEETSRTPFHGKGKPEQLKHQLTGYWSRRIDKEHRLVYSVSEDKIESNYSPPTNIGH